MQEFDSSLLLFRRRLGWPLRQLLYVSLNHFRHPAPADWPPAIRAAMNATLAPDWAFHARARALWDDQVRSYGARRLAADARAFRELRRRLVASCGARQPEERGRREFLTACIFDRNQTHCRQQHRALVCVLRAYDRCRGRDSRPRAAGWHGAGLCPRVAELVRSLAPPKSDAEKVARKPFKWRGLLSR